MPSFRQYSLLLGLILSSTFSLLSQPVRATEAPLQPPLEQLDRKPSDPDRNASANTADLSLAGRTLENFFKSDRYQTRSKVEIEAEGEGLTVQFQIQINTIAQAPNLFQSEIIFGDVDTPQAKKYLISSNGQEVTVFRPDLQEYAVMSYQTFEQSNDAFLIGFPSSLFLKSDPELRQQIEQGIFSDQSLLKQIERSVGLPIKGKRQSTKGKEYYVYEFVVPVKEYEVSIFVEPETATVEQFQIEGKDKELDLVLTERILERFENPAIADDTFHFVPPTDAEQVETLPITPFD